MINKPIITESINQYDLIDAIQNRKVIYIYYAGVDGKSNNGEGVVTKGYRTIEPYLLGVTTSGNLALRAWQQNGASDSNKGINRITRPDHDKLAGWRLFYVDGIRSFLLTGKKFSTKKGKLRPNYNPEDKQMDKIIIAIQPDDNVNNLDGIKSITTPDKYYDELSTFDNQSKKFKDFYSDKSNKQKILKKTVNDFYELVVKHRKKSPKEYFLVRKDDDSIVAINKNNINKIEKSKIIGNLKDLFIKYNKSDRPTKTFFDQQRKLFLNNFNK